MANVYVPKRLDRRYSQYDIALEKPDLLVPQKRCLTIAERVSAQGKVLIPLDETAIDAQAALFYVFSIEDRVPADHV